MAENPICLDYEMLAGGLSLLSDKARFPFIPHALATYAAACARSGRDNRLTAAVKGKRVKVFDQINLMFQLASAATTLDPEELLRRTDFDFRDISLTRLDSAFAEVRSIIFLNQQGFTNIRPIPAANRKGADISAVLNARIALRSGLNRSN